VAIQSRQEIRHFIDRLGGWYAPKFGTADPRAEAVVLQAAGFALDTISKSDAAYHDVDHTTLAALTGLESGTPAYPRGDRAPPADRGRKTLDHKSGGQPGGRRHAASLDYADHG
jgi:hypothetical protein